MQKPNNMSPKYRTETQPRNLWKSLVGCWEILMISLITLVLHDLARAQVAITEVMSNPTQLPGGGDDYWELTNFGAEEVDLHDYWFNDGVGFTAATSLDSIWNRSRWGEPKLSSGETAVFVKLKPGLSSTAEEFRHWWGESRISQNLKINFYVDHGFDKYRDTITLWRMIEGDPQLVQRIDLFQSPLGQSLVYEPTTGVFGPFSQQGRNGAFFANTTPDIGSPGVTAGKVPIQVIVSPQDTTVDAGVSLTFSVSATGLPPPAIQWLLDGSPIVGAREPSLTFSLIDKSMAGEYSCVLDNGLEVLITRPAKLVVNSEESCARIERPPLDVTVTPDQTAIFSVESRGYPLPSFRWEFEGREIPGETQPILRLENVNETMIGQYTVFVSNRLCSAQASARLSLEPKPNLVFTEAMPAPNERHTLHHGTWWELTNGGTNAVNLKEYRWNDFPADLAGAVTNHDNLVLAPGRSAIFLSSMSPESFRQWWGEENLPQDLIIISFNGNSLSTNKDFVRIWNATALQDSEWLLVSPTIIGGEPGKSLWFDPILARKGETSVEGQNSAFRAAIGGDVGSPGWTKDYPLVRRPKILDVRDLPKGLSITWTTEPQARYELWRSSVSVGPGDWEKIAASTATGTSLTVLDTNGKNRDRRFYRVIRLP